VVLKRREQFIREQTQPLVEVRSELGKHELPKSMMLRGGGDLLQLFSASRRIARHEKRVDHGVGDERAVELSVRPFASLKTNDVIGSYAELPEIVVSITFFT
jgi:hypothetical protein